MYMRPLRVTLLLCITVIAAAQQPSQPKLAVTPLTSEQIAVYRAFLADYNSGSKRVLNVANITDPFEPDTDPMISDDKNGRDTCLRAFPPHINVSEVHLLPSDLESAQIRLVNPTKHKLADPGDNIRSPQDVDAAVEAGFDHGLMTLSEVVFYTQHGIAAFSYSFVCGRLCGNGGIAVYQFRNGQWKRSTRRCSGWES
jgi:hypothetical protein